MAFTLVGKWMMNLLTYFQFRKDTDTATTPGVGRSANWFTYLQFNKDVDTAQDTRTIILTIFTLIAATTFQAGINPPGVWQDDLQTIKTEPLPVNQATEAHVASSSIFSCQKFPYYVVILSNTFAFYNSILVILLLTHKFPFKLEIRAATISLAFTYGAAIFAINAAHRCFKFAIFLAVAFLPFVIRLLLSIHYGWFSRKPQSGGKIEPYTSASFHVKLPPSALASGVKSSPVNNRRSSNTEIV